MKIKKWLLIFCLCVITTGAYAQIPLSGEVITNTTATAPEMGQGDSEYHQSPDIECNPDGRYTITWGQNVATSYPQFLKNYKRGYTATGSPVSANQDVVYASPPTAYIGSDSPKIAMHIDGSYIIVYYEHVSSNASWTSTRIYFQKYFANGIANGGRVYVDIGQYPDIDIAADGTFNISYRGGSATNSSVAYVKRYTATGTFISPRLTIDNTTASNNTGHYNTNIQSRNNNSFTVCYTLGNTSTSLVLKTYNSAGVNTVSNTITGQYISKRNFIFKPNGDIVAVSSDNHNGYNNPIKHFKTKVSRFTPGGAVTHDYISEIITPNYISKWPSIEINEQGDYVIAFQKYDNGQELGVYLQQYNINDVPVGPEYPVSTIDNSMRGVMLDVADCTFVVTWYKDEQIYHKRFKLYDEQFQITGNNSICTGDTATLTATGGYTNYLWSNGATTQSITTSTPGAYSVTAWNVNQDECSPTATFNLTVLPSPKIVLPSVFLACNGNFQGICGPTAPSGATFSYEWWGPIQGGNNSVLLSEGVCFTPVMTGSYLLEVTNQDNGCSSYHAFTVIDEIVQPDLGPDIVACEGEPLPMISIAGQGYNDPNYGITWYHNGAVVQNGGETLMTSFTSGIVTVELTYADCETVTDSIEITVKECCPRDVKLEVDCERGLLTIVNIPNGITGITSWSFNGTHINPQTIFSPTWNPTQGDGTYSVVVLFDLENGEQCKYELSVEYTEKYCCEVNGSQAEAFITSTVGTETITGTPYGTMSIPVVGCDVILDGSNSSCEDAYYMSIAPFDYTTWSNSGATLYQGWTSGQAPNNIDLEQYASFTGGEYYMIQFAVGPDWDATYILFKYEGSQAAVSMLNVNNYHHIDETKYGPMDVPAMCGRVALDGSLSTCDEAYFISVAEFNPSTWSNIGSPIYQGWTQGAAPNNIDLTQAPYNLTFNNQTYYMIQFAVGPDWDAEYLLFWYNCDVRKTMIVAPNPTTGSFTVTLDGKATSGKVEVLDLSGTTIYSNAFNRTNSLPINIARAKAGVYVLRVLLDDEVLTTKIIKE